MLCQLPPWVLMSASFRDLSLGFNGNQFTFYLNENSKFQFLLFKGHSTQMLQLEGESSLWLNNLVMTDPYYILPAIFALSNIFNAKVNEY